jgi:hypothetical protein
MNIQNKHHSDFPEAWIGLAHVTPREGNDMLQGAAGAFVPVLAWVRHKDEFSIKAISYLSMYEFDVLEIEDIEPCISRFLKYEVSDEIKTLANSLSDDNPILLLTFEVYKTRNSEFSRNAGDMD